MANKKILSQVEKSPEYHSEFISHLHIPELTNKLKLIFSYMQTALKTLNNDSKKILEAFTDTPVLLTNPATIDQFTAILVLHDQLTQAAGVLKKYTKEVNALSTKTLRPAKLDSEHKRPEIEKITKYAELTDDQKIEMLDNRNMLVRKGLLKQCFLFGGAGTRAGWICEEMPKYVQKIGRLKERFIDSPDKAKTINEFIKAVVKQLNEGQPEIKFMENEEKAKEYVSSFLSKLTETLGQLDDIKLKKGEDYSFLMDIDFGALKILRYRFELELILKEEYQKVSARTEKTEAEYIQEHMSIQQIQVSISNEIREDVETLFKTHNFFGFAPENVIFTVTPNNVMFVPSVDLGDVKEVASANDQDKIQEIIGLLAQKTQLEAMEKVTLGNLLKQLFYKKHIDNKNLQLVEGANINWDNLAEDIIKELSIPNQGHGYVLLQSNMIGGSYTFTKKDNSFVKIPLAQASPSGKAEEVSAFDYMLAKTKDGQPIWMNQNIDDVNTLGSAFDITRLEKLKDIETHGGIIEVGENIHGNKGGALVETFNSEANSYNKLELVESSQMNDDMVKTIFGKTAEETKKTPYSRMAYQILIDILKNALGNSANRFNIILNIKEKVITLTLPDNKQYSIAIPYVFGEAVSGDFTQFDEMLVKAIYEEGEGVNNFKRNHEVLYFVEKVLDIIKFDRQHKKTPGLYLRWLKKMWEKQV